jgi:hypothetical protein
MLKSFGRVVVCALLAVGLEVATARGQELDAPEPIPGGGIADADLVLPDGRPLPALPVHVFGEWDQDDLRIYQWQADLAVRGDVFEGRITLPDFPVVLPLTVQGTHSGDIVEFSVRFNGSEWSGGWFPDEVEVDGATLPRRDAEGERRGPGDVRVRQR